MPTEVLVTGATGHVGLALTRELLDAGYRVRAGTHARKTDRRAEVLRTWGATPTHADMLDPESLALACAGVDAVFHVAGVVRMWAADPEREIIGPNVEGARNVVRAAAAAGAKRVILTSSVAAVGAGTTDGRALGPDDWNHDALTPYARAKTLAELHARLQANSDGIELISICPGSVIGPGFLTHTPSTELFSWMLRGLVRATLPVSIAYIDCRSLAVLQRAALERGRASARYIAVDRVASYDEIARMAAAADGSIPVPRWKIHPRMLPALAVGDAIAAVFSGRDRKITLPMLREFADKHVFYEVSMTRADLGWEPRELSDSIAETLNWIRTERLA
ncbi:MAG: dihydroflavonol-4-reductase [Hyphomicrobiaceae bacterium]